MEKYDVQADVFSLGITLLEMLTPRNQWSPIQRILQKAHKDTILPPNLHIKLPNLVGVKICFLNTNNLFLYLRKKLHCHTHTLKYFTQKIYFSRPKKFLR